MKIEVNYSILKHILTYKNLYERSFKQLIFDSIHISDIKTIDIIINRFKFDINADSDEYINNALSIGNYDIIKLLIDSCNLKNNYIDTYLIEDIIILNKNIDDVYFKIFKYYINKFNHSDYAFSCILYFTNNKKHLLKYLIENGFGINKLNDNEKKEINIYLRDVKLNHLCQKN